MKKYESIQYMKKLQLPIPWCKLFQHEELKEALIFAKILEKYKLGVGVRTDIKDIEDHGIKTPLLCNISSHGEIEKFFKKHGNKYEYIVSESPDHNTCLANYVGYLMPDLTCIIFENDFDKTNCREAIENPSRELKKHQITLYNNNSDSNYQVPRQYLVRAFINSIDIIGKRIEFSLFKYRGYIFWQIADDESFQQIAYEKHQLTI